MKLVNLTPHIIHIFNNPDGTGEPVTIAPSGQVARVCTTDSPVDLPVDFPCFRTSLDEIVDLPPEEEGVLLITSLIVRTSSDRADIASPGKLIRGTDGQPVGCYGLALN